MEIKINHIYREDDKAAVFFANLGNKLKQNKNWTLNITIFCKTCLLSYGKMYLELKVVLNFFSLQLRQNNNNNNLVV